MSGSERERASASREWGGWAGARSRRGGADAGNPGTDLCDRPAIQIPLNHTVDCTVAEQSFKALIGRLRLPSWGK